MARTLLFLLFLLCLAAPAQAQWEQQLFMEDPQARRIAGTGRHESVMLGPFDAQVSIFSVPEPNGGGRRLYVGLVEDLFDLCSPVHLWRGPVAADWERLGPVPEYKPKRSAPNPARYLVTRTDASPGTRGVRVLMEIDLSTKPAQLRLAGSRERSGSPVPQPLEEIVPLNESFRLLPRLRTQRRFTDGKQILASYEIKQGKANPPAVRPLGFQDWQASMDSHLLLVCREDAPDRAVAYFLPMRPLGWSLRKNLPISANYRGRFMLEMFADYLVPGPDGSLMLRSARHLVTAGMDGMSVTTLELGYIYDVASEVWVKEKPAAKPGKK